jgi:hypothetical protein
VHPYSPRTHDIVLSTPFGHATQRSEVNTQSEMSVGYIFSRCYLSCIAFSAHTRTTAATTTFTEQLTVHRNISTTAQPGSKKMSTTPHNMLSTSSTSCSRGCSLCWELASFLAACKPVLDLPFRNGDEEWPNFFAAHKRLEDKNIDFTNLLAHHEHPDTTAFVQSPLHEARSGPPPVIKPVTKLSSAGRSRQRVWVEFIPAIFIKACVQVNEQWHADKSVSPISRTILLARAKELYSKQVNVLDFLFSELTDGVLEATPFLQLFSNPFLAAVYQHTLCYKEPRGC